MTEGNQNQSLNALQKPLQQVALRDDTEAQGRLNSYLLGCFSVQKMYGREPESMGAVTQVFHSVLGKYPARNTLRAFELWMERSPEFPTPADIIGLIKRNGLPPLSQAMYIAISKKDGEDRTTADWQYMRDYEAEQREGFIDVHDPVKEEATATENSRLRKEVMTLRGEVAKLAELLHEERKKNGLEKPKPNLQEKITATIEAMRKAGCPEADIEEFRKGQAGADTGSSKGRTADFGSANGGSSPPPVTIGAEVAA